MRVALNVEQLLYRSPGGVGRYTAQLLSLMASVGGDEVVPFTARHSRFELAAAMARFSAPDAAPRMQALPRPLLYEAWHRFGRPGLSVGTVDVIHSPAVAVPPRGSTPLVVTVHDAAAALFPEAFPWQGRRFHRMGMAATARRADLVIAVSHAAAAEVLAHSAITQDRIRVVSNGVDPPTIDPDGASAIRRRLGVGGRPYVLWVGSLEPRKNVRTLVAAMARLSRGSSGITQRPGLVLAGYPGWLSDDLITPADRTVLGNDLVQVGIVTEEELWALYEGATVLGFPSLHEGFGYPVVEAMTQAVPVVCSDIEVLREVAGPGALYLPATDVGAWAESLEALLGDPGGRRVLGLAGQAWSRRFGAAAAMAATRAVYAEVTGSSAGAGDR